METTLFGEDALPQVLFLFSSVKNMMVKNTKRKKKLTPPPSAFASFHKPNHFERRLLNCASVSLSHGAGSSSVQTTKLDTLAESEPKVGLVDNMNVKNHQGGSFDKYKFSEEVRAVMKTLTLLERSAIGAAAGGIAGAFTYTCLHPLDTIKTKLQTRSGAEAYKNSLDVAVKVLQTQGIAGFYSGLTAAIVGSTVSSAIYFGTCEFGKSFLSKLSNFPPLFIPPVAGAMGNIVSSAILVPKEVITQRMQAGAKGRSWNVLLKTLEKDGIKGLYVGYSASLLRNLPSGVISFSTFEYLRAAWLRLTLKDTLEPWQSVTSGALAGAIAAALTTPMDVVKTRLMTQAVKAGGSVDAAKVAAVTYRGVTETLQRIWVEEGWAGVTRGIGPRLLHSACFSAIGFFAFETARVEILKRHLAKKRVVDRV